MIEIWDGAQADVLELVKRKDAEQPDVSAAVQEIIDGVRARGDAAVLDYTERFDGIRLEKMRVEEHEIAEARESAGADFLAVLAAAAANIREYHQKQLRDGFCYKRENGVMLGQKITPLRRVGVYVPGGTASYPSTVLMDVIPAKIAGVDEIVMVTPPGKDGKVNAGILAAASVAGADVIYKAGGAQAIAALAFGTETIGKADKIVGPGNIYVATAKKLVYGAADIDMIAGPSDILIVADNTANPVFLAADMLAQAEHDENAAAVLIATDGKAAEAVRRELEQQIALLSRKEIAGASLKKNGRIILAPDIGAAIEIANALAPEHLELAVADPFAALKSVRNAGSIFLGQHTPEALGDYFAGPNHTLPTAGTARFYSPLSVDDFIKKSSYLYYPETALRAEADSVRLFAEKEGLTAHANSIAVRVKEGI